MNHWILKIKTFLLSPYPTQASHAVMWKRSLLFSIFVFIFLAIFQPFGLNLIQEHLYVMIAGYALICFLLMLVLNLLIPALFPAYFEEQKWNCGKELLWTLVNILLIGLANALYPNYLGLFSFNLRRILLFELYTLLVGMIPVSINVLTKMHKLELKYKSQSENINSELDNNQLKTTNTHNREVIDIKSENSKDSFSVFSDELLFIRAADNYSEVFFLNGEILKQKMVRNSLKEIANSLTDFPQFFRCHKSYLINLEKVIHVSGNAQGLKLHVKNCNELIPVSRNHTKTIREKLTVHP